MTLEEHRKACKEYIDSNTSMSFEALYMEGMENEYNEWIKKVKELMYDIEHSGFSKDSVLLTLEDWLAE